MKGEDRSREKDVAWDIFREDFLGGVKSGGRKRKTKESLQRGKKGKGRVGWGSEEDNRT